MQQPVRLAPSILSADFAKLGEEVRAIDKAGADYIHVDVMDGHFVPNITIGPSVVKALRGFSKKIFDVHLMIAPVDPYVKDFAEAGADIITVHPEAGPHLHRTIQLIKSCGKKAGVVLNPATPLGRIEPVLGDIDLALVMTVNPGFGGQAFIRSQLDKIRALRKMIDALGKKIDLEVDGGITPETAKEAIAAGADVLVAGTASFKGGEAQYAANLRALRGMKPGGKLLEQVRRGVQQATYGNPLYQKFLSSGDAPETLRFTPPDLWPGDAKTGLALIAEQTHLFDNPAASALRDMTAALRGLRAAGTDPARQMTLRLIAHWLGNYDNWSESEWAPERLGERIASWIGFYEFYAPASSPEFTACISASLARQWKHLLRSLPPHLTGLAGLAAVKGLIYGGLNFEGGDRALGLACDLLQRQLRAEILADGCHIKRNPSAQLHMLRHLVDLRAALQAAGLEVPGEMQASIAAMVPALKFFAHGDGGLALFNGGGEETPVLIEAVLAQSGVKSRALRRLPQGGFERLQAGRSLLIADTGSPPPRGYDDAAHAGLLSFEFGQGRERLIVNCGAMPNASEEWRRACASTAAHSALAVEDSSACEMRTAGGFAPVRVEAQRFEEDGVHCVEMAHDGYRGRFGLRHHRLLRLMPDGEELQGRETLEGEAGRFFSVRWHLHPAVQVSLSQGGQAALLRAPSGAGWRLRVEGAELALEASIYCGSGAPRRSLQLRAQSRTQGASSSVSWALTRERKG